jgi:hypothetical protein
MKRFLPMLSWFALGLGTYGWAAEPPLPKFEAQTIDGKVAIGYGVAIGDVDGDGKPDILLADKREIAWYRNGDWKKFVMAADLTPHDDVCIAARDIHGDRRVEVAVGANWNWHGNTLVVYTPSGQGGPWQRSVLADDLGEGHGLACADFLGLGSDQVIVGWRNPNAQKKVGIRLYVPPDFPGSPWKSHVIDDNTMACEDLKVADLDGDGRPEIIASGRSTHNLVIYWNRTGMKK